MMLLKIEQKSAKSAKFVQSIPNHTNYFTFLTYASALVHVYVLARDLVL